MCESRSGGAQTGERARDPPNLRPCGQPFAIVIPPGAEEIERDRLCGDCAALPAPPPEAEPGRA
jgi:hypothetical protein